MLSLSSLRRFHPHAAYAAKRASVFAVAAVACFCMTVQPVLAQAISLITDDETLQLLKDYEDPIYRAAGLDPAALHIYLVNDPEINAFAAGGQNIFVNTGLFMKLDTPNEVIGVLAHETGHIAGGHLTRGSVAASKASIPMLVAMAAGVAAMIAGACSAGMGVFMLGQQVAQGQFNAFSRAQEGTADQMGQKYLRATKQSGRGMLKTFQKLADEEAMSAYRIDAWARSHPASRERIAELEDIIEKSPYKDVPDSPESLRRFAMVKAKLFGFTADVDVVLRKYPPGDESAPARYARAIAYMRKPDLAKAQSEIKSLIAEHPDNPFFHQVLGQIYVNMAKPELGVPSLQKASDLYPEGTEIRVELAAAQLATENVKYAQPALDNLKVALQKESDNAFAWYETALAYSMLNNEPMANLATAERYYSIGAYPQAQRFASIAQRGLSQGTPDWQRANDIISISAAEKKNRD
ncbi:MAG: M48 family metallopeptidase [Alphaproteobacteria bacterium]|nr:M48 family metallopeptidase [Alphaproteobacteria bacterium]